MQARYLIAASFAALAAAASASVAFAASSATVTSAPATASITIASPVSITKTTDMSFGTVTKPSDSSTPTISLNATTGVVTAGSGAAALPNSGASAAVFTVAGPIGMTFTPVTGACTPPGSGNNICSLTGFAITPETTGQQTITGSGATGTFLLRYGGSLQISSSTANGVWSGTFTVTVNYP